MLQISIIILFITVVSALTVLSILPKVLYISLKKNLVDNPDERKRHRGKASRLGGVSFLPAILIAMFVGLASTQIFGLEYTVYNFNYQSALNIVALFMLYLIGFYDDLVGVGFRKKFVIQILASCVVIIAGIHLTDIYGFETPLHMPMVISIPLTILLIVFITNALNLIDGMNGLASLISIMAFAVYGAIFLIYGETGSAFLCFASLGALVPFFYCNVFRLRRRTKAMIFMGDCGALVVGFLLSICAIRLWNLSGVETIIISPDYAHIMAFTMLLVPCLDVVRIVLYRAKNHKPLFLPDNNHIHHKTRDLGFNDTHSLYLIIGIQLFFVLLNTALAAYINILLIFVIDVVVWTVLHIIIRKKINTKPCK